MLERLDTVDWANLRHAYGPATDVPALIRALASKEQYVRDQARYQLYGNIHHQGDVYPASAYAVPFLIELLTVPEVEDKQSLLALLQTLADGYAYLSLYHQRPWVDNYYEYRYQREQVEARQHQQQAWAQQSHAAVLQGLPVYLALLSDGDKAIREMAAFVLSCCFEYASEIMPQLQVQIALESDTLTKTAMIFGIYQLWLIATQQTGEAPLPELELELYLTSLLTKYGEPMVQIVAALALAALGNRTGVALLLEIFPTLDSAVIDEFSRLRMRLARDSSLIDAISQTLSVEPARQTAWLIDLLAHPNPEIRGDALWTIARVCAQRRNAPAQFAPHLPHMLADADPQVRKAAYEVVIQLGRARRQLVQPIELLRMHPSRFVQQIAQETLDKIQQIEEGLQKTASIDQWLGQYLMKDKTAIELADLIEAQLEVPRGQFATLDKAINTLAAMGPAASAAAPAIRKALNHHYWFRTCIYAARALWRIERNIDETLPLFLEAITPRVGLGDGHVAVVCLGEMGRYAQMALPRLREFAESPLRSEDFMMSPIVDGDEWLQRIAHQAVAQIEADPAKD